MEPYDKGNQSDEKTPSPDGQSVKKLKADHLPRTVEELQEWLDKHNGVTNKEEKPQEFESIGSTYEITFFSRVPPNKK